MRRARRGRSVLSTARGHSAAWSGSDCTDWYGHIVDVHYAIQGNMLVSVLTLQEMARSFRESVALDLAERLLLALEAGDAAGGDGRGRQSAALEVYHVEDYALFDLRVDEHPRPVAELRRIYGIAKLQLLPFVDGMPHAQQPGRRSAPSRRRLVGRSAADAPGRRRQCTVSRM